MTSHTCRSAKLLITLVSLTLVACSATKSPGESVGLSAPTVSDRLEKVFNPPWWYHGPVKYAYDKAFPPPWYQGSLEWVQDEVTAVCDDKVAAMARATRDSSLAVTTPNQITIVYGVVRVAGTTGIVTYCKLKG